MTDTQAIDSVAVASRSVVATGIRCLSSPNGNSGQALLMSEELLQICSVCERPVPSRRPELYRGIQIPLKIAREDEAYLHLLSESSLPLQHHQQCPMIRGHGFVEYLHVLQFPAVQRASQDEVDLLLRARDRHGRQSTGLKPLPVLQ